MFNPDSCSSLDKLLVDEDIGDFVGILAVISAIQLDDRNKVLGNSDDATRVGLKQKVECTLYLHTIKVVYVPDGE
jgi:hypothetical protein